MTEKIIVVTDKGCPFCKMTKEFLDKKGTKYTEMTPEEYEKIYKKEVLSIPITCSDKGKCVFGFDPEKINKKLLKT